MKSLEQLLAEQYEIMKLEAAREVYRKGPDTLTPSGITWAQWFQSKYKENWKTYTERKKAEKSAGQPE